MIFRSGTILYWRVISRSAHDLYAETIWKIENVSLHEQIEFVSKLEGLSFYAALETKRVGITTKRIRILSKIKIVVKQPPRQSAILKPNKP